MRDLPTGAGLGNHEHSPADASLASAQMKCHDRNRRSRKIDAHVLRLDVLEWSFRDASLGGNIALQVKLPAPRGLEFSRAFGPLPSRARNRRRVEHHRVVGPTLAKGRPV